MLFECGWPQSISLPRTTIDCCWEGSCLNSAVAIDAQFWPGDSVNQLVVESSKSQVGTSLQDMSHESWAVTQVWFINRESTEVPKFDWSPQVWLLHYHVFIQGQFQSVFIWSNNLVLYTNVILASWRLWNWCRVWWWSCSSSSATRLPGWLCCSTTWFSSTTTRLRWLSKCRPSNSRMVSSRRCW